jgi:1-deoxy-D-xylulose-5-phosphate reductoisomerase
MRTRRVVILGATGSIGKSARKVAHDIPGRMEVSGLSAHWDTEGLAAAASEFPKAKTALSSGPDGEQRLIELATLPEADMVLIAIVGTAGLRPALAAIEAGKDLAVASKEILVMAGEIIMAAAARKGVKVLPVDSEHNAIFQCLDGREGRSLQRIILTCSGGPFRATPRADLESVTPEMALRHPTWSMGRKISIDSATLFNKGLEMIEARWLFDIPMEKVDVVIHPQSIVHSMVEFVDGSLLAQLSHSDMCFPIQYAVTWPERVANCCRARRAGEVGGSLPATLNAANEVAVQAFLEHRIRFPRIWEVVERVMDECPFVAHPCLEELADIDRNARELASQAVSAARFGG